MVDQPASIAALAVAVARSMAIDVAYLPGLAMRRIADLHPGRSKTDELAWVWWRLGSGHFGCQVPGLVEVRFSRSGGLPDGLGSGV